MVKWSYSGLKDYVTCSHQYHQTRILNNYKKDLTQHMIYGLEVHKALEEYVKDNKPLPKNYQSYKGLMDVIMDIPGVRYPEQKLAMTKERAPCSFDDSNYWVRGIVDLLIHNNNTGYILDYKTGSNKYPDIKQLKLMSLMTFAHYPEIERIKAGLLFIAHNDFVNDEYTRTDIPELWGAFSNDLVRLNMSHEKNFWPKNPSGLCGWCPVNTCEFWKPRR